MLLRKSGAVFHTSAEKEVVRLIKEKTAYIAQDPKKEEKEWAGGGSSKMEEYKLPDGNILKVCDSSHDSYRKLRGDEITLRLGADI